MVERNGVDGEGRREGGRKGIGWNRMMNNLFFAYLVISYGFGAS